MAILNKELGPIEGRDEEKVLGVGGWTSEEFDKLRLMYQVFRKCNNMDSFSEVNRDWVSKNQPDEVVVDDLKTTEAHLKPDTQPSSHPIILDTPLSPPPSKTTYYNTPTRKMPTLEAPLICTSKRTPKPNHRFLDNVWEDDFESHSRNRKKSHSTDKNDTPISPLVSETQSTFSLAKKKIKCCVCNGIKELQRRMKDLGNFCCSECADFYLEKAPMFIKGKLNIACKFEPS